MKKSVLRNVSLFLGILTLASSVFAGGGQIGSATNDVLSVEHREELESVLKHLDFVQMNTPSFKIRGNTPLSFAMDNATGNILFAMGSDGSKEEVLESLNSAYESILEAHANFKTNSRNELALDSAAGAVVFVMSSLSHAEK